MRSIFIGGIPLTSTKQLILSFLSRYDSVEHLYMPRDQATGQLKGYARAVLRSAQGVQDIIDSQPHLIGDLTVGVSRWKNQSEYLSNKDQLKNTKVYVKFPACLIRADLFEYFTFNYGRVVEVDIKTDPFTKRFRNFCYVVFESEESAILASAQRDQVIKFKQVVVEMSKPAHLAKQMKVFKQEGPQQAKDIKNSRSGVNEGHPQQTRNSNKLQSLLTKDLLTSESTKQILQTSLDATEKIKKDGACPPPKREDQIAGFNYKGSSMQPKEPANRTNKSFEHLDKPLNREAASTNLSLLHHTFEQQMFNVKPTSRLYHGHHLNRIQANHCIKNNIQLNIRQSRLAWSQENRMHSA